MRFVDRDEPHARLLQQTPQRRAAVTRDAFRRYVQQPAAIFAHAGDDGVPFVRRLRAVQERGLHPVDAEAVDLILHQRDERRDHQPDAAGLHDRRRLETERLSAAGRQHDDAVARREDGQHRFALKRTETGEAPDAMQGVLEGMVESGEIVSVWRICARRNHRRDAGTVRRVPRRCRAESSRAGRQYR